METGNKEFMDESQKTIEVQGKSVEQKRLDDLACSNPFLFNLKDNPNTLFVIEDFYIQYKEHYIKFEELIRSDLIVLKDKKKAINNQISEWEKNTESKIYDVFKESKAVISRCRINKISKIGFKYYFMLMIGIVIPILLILNIIPVISFMEEYYYTFAYSVIGVSLIGLLIAISKERKRMMFLITLNKHKRNHEFLSRQLFKKLSKISKKIKKYYVKNLNDEIFIKDPLLIENINYVGNKLEIFNKSVKELDELNTKIANTLRKKTSRRLVIFISYLTSTISIIYILIMLVMNLIEKLH